MALSSDNFHIKQAVASDARLISALASTTFYEAYFEQDESKDLAEYIYESFNPDAVTAELNDPKADFYILSIDNVAAGYAKLLSDSSHPSLISVNPIELKRIYIVERCWGKGWGEVLLNHCLGLAKDKGFDSLWLGVWEQNERGRHFYEKHGFLQTGTLEFPYGDTVGINNVLEKIL